MTRIDSDWTMALILMNERIVFGICYKGEKDIDVSETPEWVRRYMMTCLSSRYN